MHMFRIPSLSVLACFTVLAALAACENGVSRDRGVGARWEQQPAVI